MHKSVALLIVLFKICSSQAQYFQENSQTSRYRDERVPQGTEQVQKRSYNYSHSHHHHHGHSHYTENDHSSSRRNNSAGNTELWMQIKAVPSLTDRNSGSQTVGEDDNKTFTAKVTRNANITFSSENCTYGICDTVKNYPAEKIANIISKSRELRQYFDENIPPTIFHNRFGEDEPMCPTMLHWRFPQSAKNTKNVEMLLVNVDEKYKQAVFYETCLKEGSPCMYQDLFPDGYVTTCTQKFTTRRLMAVGTDSDQPIFDNFNMPSCCVCTIKKPSRK